MLVISFSKMLKLSLWDFNSISSFVCLSKLSYKSFSSSRATYHKNSNLGNNNKKTFMQLFIFLLIYFKKKRKKKEKERKRPLKLGSIDFHFL